MKKYIFKCEIIYVLFVLKYYFQIFFSKKRNLFFRNYCLKIIYRKPNKP